MLEGLCGHCFPQCVKSDIFPLGSPVFQLWLEQVALSSGSSWDFSINMGFFDCKISLSNL